MKKVHFVGIGGSGISGVSLIAQKLGYEVTGCDEEGSSAYNSKIEVGHSPKHIEDVDLVVTSPSLFFGDENDEIKTAKEKGILLTWQEFLGKHLSGDKKMICIAGTHGKSTTTAMAGRLLEDAGLDPTVVVGAKVPRWDGNSRFGKGEWVIVEADEFFDNFLNYSPEIIVLNNIEFDHPDYFRNEEQLFESFRKFVGNLKGLKILICNGDSDGVNRLLEEIDTSGVKILKYSSKEQELGFKLGIGGAHNISNALGVKMLAEVLEIDKDVLKKTLENFDGIGRRMELINNIRGIEVYDDYAHHPTAIKVTLEALRDSHPNARIWAIIEPHGYSRTKALLSKYKGIFDPADRVIIGPIFKARDTDSMGMSAKAISENTGHKNATYSENFDEIKTTLKTEVKAGDVIVVMGAGKSYIWARAISELFNKKW
jgi:UDP-N-acetylmuramate--alanine ligase